MSDLTPQEGAETPFKVIACCFPLVGAILYFVWRNDKPEAASDVCKFALIGVGVSFLLNLVGVGLGVLSTLASGGF